MFISFVLPERPVSTIDFAFGLVNTAVIDRVWKAR
jgi:hypothetical protein